MGWNFGDFLNFVIGALAVLDPDARGPISDPPINTALSYFSHWQTDVPPPRMDHFKGLEIDFVSEGKPLTLYTDEDEEQPNETTRGHYIEALTGATFKFVAELALLERTGNIKKKGFATKDRVKHELKNVENRPQKRAQRSNEIETVDLTADPS
ncbi:hypothetical protein MMC21_004737 [Puttea exsequens]|nr:hypothetical protein [Puttea exsequens]